MKFAVATILMTFTFICSAFAADGNNLIATVSGTDRSLFVYDNGQAIERELGSTPRLIATLPPESINKIEAYAHSLTRKRVLVDSKMNGEQRCPGGTKSTDWVLGPNGAMIAVGAYYECKHFITNDENDATIALRSTLDALYSLTNF